MLEKISSKYLLNHIFFYIKDEYFKYKVFAYSKLFQNKLGINSNTYIIKFIEKNKIDLNKLLYCERQSHIRIYNNIDSKLSKRLNDLKGKYKLKYEHFKEYLIQNFDKIQKENKINENESEYFLDIYSRFFNWLSQTKTKLLKYFTIIINSRVIKKYNLNDGYNPFKIKLKDFFISKKEYSSLLFIYKNTEDIIYLKELNINFNQIKKLYIIHSNYDIARKNNNFLKELFSFNIFNSLQYLYIDALSFHRINLFSPLIADKEVIGNLNNFKSLIKLGLEGFFLFGEELELNLENLQYLTLKHCHNILISNRTCQCLKKLKIIECGFPKNDNKLQFPELEELTLVDRKDKYDFLIDFSSLIKLRYIEKRTFDPKIDDITII